MAHIICHVQLYIGGWQVDNLYTCSVQFIVDLAAYKKTHMLINSILYCICILSLQDGCLVHEFSQNPSKKLPHSYDCSSLNLC